MVSKSEKKKDRRQKKDALPWNQTQIFALKR
jgi:hypothetical protein